MNEWMKVWRNKLKKKSNWISNWKRGKIEIEKKTDRNGSMRVEKKRIMKRERERERI